jgi:hypothetical protein
MAVRTHLLFVRLSRLHSAVARLKVRSQLGLLTLGLKEGSRSLLNGFALVCVHSWALVLGRGSLFAGVPSSFCDRDDSVVVGF